MNYTEKAGIASLVCGLAGLSSNIFLIGPTLPIAIYYLYKMTKE